MKAEFQKVSQEEYLKRRLEGSQYLEDQIEIPKQSTENSAGYDFILPFDIKISKHNSFLVPTGIKIKLRKNQHLQVHIRSSLGVKKGLKIKNTVGIIDSDYYNNPDNEGHIFICLENTTAKDVELKKGEKIAQGIILKFYRAKGKKNANKRKGGIGSTGK